MPKKRNQHVRASIVVYIAPKEIDWSSIADLISEGYTQGIDRPQGTHWELFDSPETFETPSYRGTAVHDVS